MVAAQCFTQLLGLVNVILVHNTIRVLRPVMDATSSLFTKTTGSGKSDIESFSTPEMATEKAQNIRATLYSAKGSPAPSIRLTHSRASSVASTMMSHESGSNLLSHQRQASASSFNSVPRLQPAATRGGSGDTSYSPVARAAMHRPMVSTQALALPPRSYTPEAITPVAELNAQLDAPLTPRAPSPLVHGRSYSTDSVRSLGLPPPPRAGRRSPVQRAPSIEHSPSRLQAPLTPMAPVTAAAPKRPESSGSALRPESVYSLYLQRSPHPEDAGRAFQQRMPTARLVAEDARSRRPSMTAFGIPNSPNTRQ
jgi:hypothetical protein